MRFLKRVSIAAAAVSMSACVTTGTQSLQCSLSRMIGQECAGPMQHTADRWAKVQHAFDAEIESARNAQDKAVNSTASLPSSQRATAGEVTTRDIQIVDSQTNERHSVRTLETVTMDLPLEGKGTAAHLAAFNTMMDFANLVADDRGSAFVTVYQNAADVKAGRANPSGGVLSTKNGNSVTVRKQTNAGIPQGVERYVIKSGEVRGQL